MEPKTILVVDDEQAVRHMLAFMLKREGYAVIEAANANTASTMIADHRPDLILLDWMMPGITGIELTRSLRKDSFSREIPIIMLTARAEEEDKIRLPLRPAR